MNFTNEPRLTANEISDHFAAADISYHLNASTQILLAIENLIRAVLYPSCPLETVDVLPSTLALCQDAIAHLKMGERSAILQISHLAKMVKPDGKDGPDYQAN